MGKRFYVSSLVLFVFIFFLSFLLAPRVYAARDLQLSPELKKALGNKFNYHALVIGNNDYRHLPKLKTAVNDAKVVAEVLRDQYGFKTRLLLNATRAEIIRNLSNYRKTLTNKDNLIIYYAGHGYLDEAADTGYWLPVDATTEDDINWVSNSSITGKLKAMLAKHVLIVADSCYSGKLVRGLSIKKKTPDYIALISRKKARVVLASGGLEPVSDSGGKGNHSVFASAFIDALRENTGVMDGTELFIKIRRPVMLNSDQTPEYADIRKAGHDGGDFLFIRTAALATSPSVTDIVPEAPSPLPFPTAPEPPRPLALQGHLQVNVNVSSARVILNGEDVGTAGQGSPLNLKNLSEGTVLVRVESEGYIPLERNAVIRRNEWTQEAFILKRKQKKMASLTQDMGKALQGTSSSDGRYIDHGDGTITDSNAGLMWTKKDSYADLGKCFDWNASKSYVSGLSTGGYTDWRLPTVNELKAIYEKSKSSNVMTYDRDSKYPLHLDSIFADGAAYWYWSSETVGSSRARNVSFYNGTVYKDARDHCTYGGVRAVRR